MTVSTATATSRRSLRRRRATGRRGWYLHRKGIIYLSRPRLRQIFLVLQAHHSQDPGLLRQVAAAMATETRAPWRCGQCKQLRKHSVQYCITCQQPWQNVIDTSYAHGSKNPQPTSGGGQYQQAPQQTWPNAQGWQQQWQPSRGRTPSPRQRARAKSAKGAKSPRSAQAQTTPQAAQPPRADGNAVPDATFASARHPMDATARPMCGKDASTGCPQADGYAAGHASYASDAESPCICSSSCEAADGRS